MRSRVIKPGFFSDAALGRLPIGARLLFAGLWCLADRAGRLIDSPRWIAGQVFPYDEDDITEHVRQWLEDLAGGGFIVRYQAQGGRYIQVTNFAKHQPVHSRESPSTIPPPDTPNEKSTSYPVKPVPEFPRLSREFSPARSRNFPGSAGNFPRPVLLLPLPLPLPTAAYVNFPTPPLPPKNRRRRRLHLWKTLWKSPAQTQQHSSLPALSLQSSQNTTSQEYLKHNPAIP